MQHKRRLTEKQAKLVKSVEANPSATYQELGLQADYKDRQNVYRALNSPNVQKSIKIDLENHPGLNRAKRLEKLAEGLEAWNRDPVGPEDMPDFSVRHKYLETTFKLSGELNSEDHERPTNQILIINDIKESRDSGISR